jgi:hypothetical protein
MEGLKDVEISTANVGPAIVRLTFHDPPGATIEAAEWAMRNRVPFPYGPHQRMTVLDIGIEHDDVFADTIGGARYVVERHRIVTISGPVA